MVSVHLRRVSVQGFRSLGKLEATLRPGLNVVVGRNNVGKTALIDAIRICLGPASTQSESIRMDEDDFHIPPGSTRETGTKRPVKISAEFADATDEQQAQLIELLDYDAVNPGKSTLRVHFEATWDERRRRFHPKRWGGAADGDRALLDGEILANIPLTHLPALRDANLELQPGMKNRLARLLDRRTRQDGEARKRVREIFAAANKSLDEDALVQGLAEKLRTTTRNAAGSDFSSFSVAAAEADYIRILRTLRVVLDAPISDIASTGLGYGNILFMATVLAHLEEERKEGVAPILLIEEPEAHLHPQLTQLLASYLAGRTAASPDLQVIATSHSPTFAAHVRPSQIVSMSARPGAAEVACNHLGTLGLDEQEESQLQRMMDITRSTLYYSKAFILVEGPCEALLLPTLSRRIDPALDLTRLHVSTIPISGVSFNTFRKILDEKGVAVPVAIVTDGDPAIISNGDWREDSPTRAGDGLAVCERTSDLVAAFEGHPLAKVFASGLTLEHELALERVS